jgi:hypothetical protein
MKLRHLALLVLAFMFAACAAPATPQTIEVTRIVEGEPQIVVVTATSPVEAPAPAEPTSAPAATEPSTGINRPPSGGGTTAPTAAPTATLPPNLTFNLSSNPRWQNLTAASAPSARYDHTLTFDAVDNQLILFGGRNGSTTLNDTWIYDLDAKTWRRVNTSTAPSARHSHAAAYDAASRRWFIFGGQATGVFGDVWAFDTQSETWQEIRTAGAGPAARYGTSAAIDRGNLIITHGFANQRFDDTFALDLTANRWASLTPTDKPFRRCLHESVFDAKSGRMILFGGCSSPDGPCPRGDLWSFNVTGRSWTEMDPETIKPSPRSNPGLVGDNAGHALLFGGNTSSGPISDLWLYDIDNDDWVDLTIDGGPSARYSHDAAWVASSGQLFLFGGRDRQGALGDMWVYTP